MPAWWNAKGLHVNKEKPVLYTIAGVLLIAWLLGIGGAYTMGAFVHLLLVVAIVLVVVRMIGARHSMA